MGWFPCSGRSSDKQKKKKPSQDDPTTSPFSTSTSTSTPSSGNKKINPRSNVKKEENPRPDVRKEVNPRSNMKREVSPRSSVTKDANHRSRKEASPRSNVKREAHHHHNHHRSHVKKEVHHRPHVKKEVNSRPNGNKDVNPLLNLNNGMSHLLNLKEGSEISENSTARIFTFSQLEAATKNFREGCFLGEGGFGRVYKGKIEGIDQVLAIKKLDRHSAQGNKEFLVEVLMLGLLHHPNLVNLVGYCADGHQRLLVYEYMPLGSLEDHLHDPLPRKKPLDWNARMKIAAGAAKGLEYLHDKANPPVIYRDLKSANILLDETYHAKLSDFGLAKLGPTGGDSHVSTRVMGTYGYCAPEYAMTGQLTLKSDIYSFGVVLLEIITGRRAMDYTKPAEEQNLVNWARPLFKDRKNFTQMVDPKLKGLFPLRGMYQALAVAAMCVQEQATLRPAIGDVVTALSYLASQAYLPEMQSAQSSPVAASSKVWPRNDSMAMRNHTL